MLIRVVIGVDDTQLRKRALGLVDDPDVLAVAVGSRADALGKIASHSHDLAFVDAREADDELRVLQERMTELPDRPQLVVLLVCDDAKARAELLAQGAAVLDASQSDALLRAAFGRVVAGRREAERRRFELNHRVVAREPALVSRSPAMQRVVDTAQRVARADSAVLLLGETGVGKERLAALIHAASPRSQGPFVPVNCAALPTELFESELFGHEKGAFTGAARARRGHFELAHEGTLFLDEVGEVPLHLQAKLLRALQERRIQPLGSERSVEVDVRVIAATNRDLVREMAIGAFRRDLYYRLAVVELPVPPLRERVPDIAPIAEAYLRRYAAQMNRDVEGLDPLAVEALEHYDWPGNVRELTNVIERVVLLSASRRIQLADLPSSISVCAGISETGDDPVAPSLLATEMLSEVVRLPPEWARETWRSVREGLLLAGERAYLAAVLETTAGRVGEAARRAGMSPRALFDKMRRHGLRKEDFRG